MASAWQIHSTEVYVDQRNEINDYEVEVSELVLPGNMQDSGCKRDAGGTVPLEVDRLARCRTVTRARHSRGGPDRVFLREDGYTQVEALARRVDRAGDRVPGSDNTGTLLACNPSVLEGGWDAAEELGAEEAEATA